MDARDAQTGAGRFQRRGLTEKYYRPGEWRTHGTMALKFSDKQAGQK
jgi:hypothetical protein